MMMFAKIRFFYNAFIIFLAVAFIMIPLITLFKSHKGAIMHHANRLILFLTCGKVETMGKMDMDADMFIMNHQGIMDIICMEATQKNHLAWVAKKELFELPYIGKLLKNGGMISIDRSDKRGAIVLLKEIKNMIENEKRKIAIFPEGTRAKNQKLLSFKVGAKMIAEKLQLKVQPVVITGSKHFLNESKQISNGGVIIYHFLPTIDTKNSNQNWYEDMQTDMQGVIDNEFTNNNRSR
jgi:1-acyl-sn-glycerol-3-phosphate acyltransferase